MKKIDFELLNVENPYVLVDFEEEIFIINSQKELNDLNLKLDNIIDFEKDLIIGLKFFGGSVPKRTIKYVSYDFDNGNIFITTNRKDITFTTMDLRLHLFLIKIPKLDISDINYE